MSKTFTLKATPDKNDDATTEPAAMTARAVAAKSAREGDELLWANRSAEIEKDPALPTPSAVAGPKPFRLK